ncbi:MAG TPA: redoxin domain-containing protein [Polyangiaceae bacterium]|jgi:peroxiredoxin Q/BCP
MKKTTARSPSAAASKKKVARPAAKPVAKSTAKRKPALPAKKAGGPASGPKVGAPAPSFSLPSDAGNSISLSDYRGKWVVVYFYPKDHTPGCTREAIAFEGATKAFAAEGAVVLGVSRDSVATHCSFKSKQGLRFPLLSDPSADVHRLYGAYGEKMMYGKLITGALRTTAIVRPDGTLAKIFSSVKVDGHSDAVLETIRGEKKILEARA